MPQPDLLVVTAANANQARGYEAQLAWRRRRGLLDDRIRTLVVPDCGDRRIGSGASTFLALREAAKALAEAGHGPRSRSRPRRVRDLFVGRRVWIIHSGGDSRRLPAYAAMGKAFVPLPIAARDGRPSSIFEEVLADLAHVALAEGVLVAAGDLVVGLAGPREATSADGEAGSLALSTRSGRPPAEVVGIAARLPMETARRHGVFVASTGGAVVDFLQKPDEETARRRGAVDGTGRLFVDTGVVALAPAAAERWLAAAGVALRRGRFETRGVLAAIEARGAETGRGRATGRSPLRAGPIAVARAARPPSIDLYLHVLAALAGRLRERTYLADCGAEAPRARALLAALRRRLRIGRFDVVVAPAPVFRHAGTTRELVAQAQRLRDERPTTQVPLAVGDPSRRRSPLAPVVIGSRVAPRSIVGRDVLIEGCDLRRGVECDGQNSLVGLPPGTPRLRLPRGACLAAIPVGREDWAVVAFGAFDDFKTPVGAGGTLINVPWERWREADREAWDPIAADPASTLYDLPIWPVGDFRRTLRIVDWMLRGPNARRRRDDVAAWSRAPRRSLRELVAMASHARLIRQRDEIAWRIARSTLPTWLAQRGAIPASSIAGLAPSRAEALELASVARRAARRERRPIVRAEALMVAEAAFRGGGRPREALAARREAIALAGAGVREDAPPPRGAFRAAVRPGEEVRCTAPVRVDLAGGWSDTPPICNAVGGRVVNVAIRLDGKAPVEVVATRLATPCIVLRSVDADDAIVVRDGAELRDHADPRQWTALPKAALCLMGFAPMDRRVDLRRHLERFGGGVEITMRSAVPRGSGLGTSSILGATLVAALARLRGERLAERIAGERRGASASASCADLLARASALEQMIATRGGWQDQVGGVVPGFKLAWTDPAEPSPGMMCTDAVGGVEAGASRPRKAAAQVPTVRRLEPPSACVEALCARTVVLYTGRRRMARDILESVVARWLAREDDVVATVARLKAGAARLADALDRGDAESVIREFALYWLLKRTIDPASTTPQIDAIFDAQRADLAAWGLAGAGGGGFALLIAKDARAAQRVRRRLRRDPPHPAARVFDLEIDEVGLRTSVGP